MKKLITKLDTFLYYYPKIVTVVGVKFGEKINFMAAAWNTPLSFDPPMFGVAIAPKRYSYELITKAGEFTANFLPFEKLELVHKTGRTSGRDVDKVKQIPVSLEPSHIIHSPGIKEAYTFLECVLIDVRKYGDHDFFVSEVKAVHYDENGFDDQGIFQVETVNPVLYLGENTYATTLSTSKIKKPKDVRLSP